MRPLGGRFTPGHVVAHVLLVERADGLLLVDSGIGTADIAAPTRLGRAFVSVVRPALDVAETAVCQVEALGFAAADVRDIVLTHMDLDHAGGIGDFPHARVHVDHAEFAAARRPKLSERSRYRGVQWAHGPEFVTHATEGDRWLGFESVRAVGDDVLLVPLRGHSRGHCGVAVRDRARGDDAWLLHAGDAYFHHGEVATPTHRDPVLTFFQKVIATDERARRHNQQRLAELVAAPPDGRVLSAHDELAFARLAR